MSETKNIGYPMNAEVVIFPTKAAFARMSFLVMKTERDVQTPEAAVDRLKKNTDTEGGYRDTLFNIMNQFPFLFKHPEKNLKSVYMQFTEPVTEVVINIKKKPKN